MLPPLLTRKVKIILKLITTAILTTQETTITTTLFTTLFKSRETKVITTTNIYITNYHHCR